MKKKSILVLGSGRSSTTLISYLLDHAKESHWHVIIGDRSAVFAKKIIADTGQGEFVFFDLENEEACRSTIQCANVVISLLPAFLHAQVARWCLAHKKHLFTASYVSAEMESMHQEAQDKGLLFMNECGLDPGIDHMSALQVIDQIREKGGKILSFKSFAGGLITPDTDIENPWRYKFTWNPQSVVKAGQGVARLLHDGQRKYIPYCKLFKQITPVHIPEYGDFVGYANRDSLKYIELYELGNIQTMLRGTLRTKGFCTAWNTFVQLGCTDDTYSMEQVGGMTHYDFIDSFLPAGQHGSIEKRLSDFLQLDPHGHELKCIKWLDCFEKKEIGIDKGTPAQILEHILNKKWKLKPVDKDMVVMWHQCHYEHEGKEKKIQTYIAYEREGAGHTAMAKGVGLPLAIVTKLFLQGKISQRGVHIPVEKNIYTPVLQELRQFGIQIVESE